MHTYLLIYASTQARKVIRSGCVTPYLAASGFVGELSHPSLCLFVHMSVCANTANQPAEGGLICDDIEPPHLVTVAVQCNPGPVVAVMVARWL